MTLWGSMTLRDLSNEPGSRHLMGALILTVALIRRT
jgi:hypothetical protein